MGYTNTCEISEIIFPLRAAQISPQLKYQLCLVLVNLERKWPGKCPDESNKKNNRFYQKT